MLLSEYKHANQLNEGQVNRACQKWQRPPAGVIKINFDGSVKMVDKRGGIGVIARDDKGEVLGALQAVIAGTIDLGLLKLMMLSELCCSPNKGALHQSLWKVMLWW